MTIKDIIRHLQAGDAPEFRVVIEVGPSESRTTIIKLEPYSIRWESDAVVIEADYEAIK